MPDDPTDAQAECVPSGKPGSEGSASTPQDATTETADEPVSSKPVAVSGDDAGVGMTEAPEPDIKGNREM